MPITLCLNEIPKTHEQLDHSLYFESFGVTVSVSSNDAEALDAVANILPNVLANQYRITGAGRSQHEFVYLWDAFAGDSAYQNGELIGTHIPRNIMLDVLGSRIRIAVAEYTVDAVFVHAAVVAWNGKAIVMPAATFKGKSTLATELIRRGALYYSDEYAIFDKHGIVSPFPKMLSLRVGDDEIRQVDHPPETFGGRTGTSPIPVGLVLITEYKPGATWRPRKLSGGTGVSEMIRHAISVQRQPALNLEVLSRVAEQARILKTPRGDAREAARLVLGLMDSADHKDIQR